MRIEAVEHEIDARWTMAYAAALRDERSEYFDTTTADGIVAHPAFVVCPEWAAIVNSRESSLAQGVTAAEMLTSVHATHDTTIHRLVRPGDVLSTSLEIVGLVNKSPGAMSTMRLQTVDADGAPVATTTQDGIYLGVQAASADVADPQRPEPLNPERIGDPAVVSVPVFAGDAHTYTECARIWNPIHTNKQVALDSGLPDIILHGTANLAHGVTAALAAHELSPTSVRRISCRFASMVRLPSTITVLIWPTVAHGDGTAVPFEVRNADGDPAVKDGVLLVG